MEATATRPQQEIEQCRHELHAEHAGMASQRRHYQRLWIGLETAAIAIGFLTSLLVAMRNTDPLLKELWVYWCVLMPPLASVALLVLKNFHIHEKYLLHTKQSQQYKTLLDESRLRELDCRTDFDRMMLCRYILSEKARINALAAA